MFYFEGAETPPSSIYHLFLHVFKKMIGIPCLFNDSKDVKADVSDIFFGPAQDH